MDLKHLVTFIAVAEELSFHRGAARVNLTQPPVTLQIKSLERELGVRLFDRGGRKKLQLTDAGKILLEGALITVQMAKRTVENVTLHSEGGSGDLHIGHSDDFLYGLLPRVLSRFHAEFTNVRTSLRQNPSVRLTEQVLNGEIDLGFVCLPIPRLDSSILIQPLPSTPIVAVVPKTHRLAGKGRIWLRELANEMFYLMPDNMTSGYSFQISRLFTQAGITPKKVGITETSIIAVQVAANGFGVTLASLSSIDANLKDASILRLKDPKPELDLGLICTSRNRDLPLVRGFIRVLEQVTGVSGPASRKLSPIG